MKNGPLLEVGPFFVYQEAVVFKSRITLLLIKHLFMKNILLFVLTFHAFQINAQNPTLAWVNQSGSTNADQGNAIAIDAAGNIYSTGNFNGTVDFDPSAGTSNLTSAGGTDVFIRKLDPSGNFVWGLQVGGTSADAGNGLILDGAGNIYITGSFSGTADFDPAVATSNLVSAGMNDIFVLKLSASGLLVWAKQLGGTSNDEGRSIATDATGNVFTTGYFSNTADFDPGAGTSNLTSTGSFEIFVSKLDNAGNFSWAKQLGGTGNDMGYSITTDLPGNVYTTGHFSLTADFDPGAGIQNLTSAGAGDAFISKLDASGNFSWAKQMGGTANDVSTAIAVDASGYIYTSGYFFDTADFDPGVATANLTTNGVGDIFVSKLNSSGNYVWARNMGGSLDDFAHALAVDNAGGVYTTGFYAGSADFDPGAGTSYLHSYFPSDSLLIRDQIFVSKLDSSGTFAWAVALGGVKGYGIAATTSAVYSTGFFTATADFDPAATIFNMTTAGSDDIYVHKMDQGSLGTNESYSTSFALYPNPAMDNFTIRTATIADAIIITDLLGNEVMKLQPATTETTVNTDYFASGVYFVRVITGSAENVSRLVLSE
jgi:hypothetical protein